MKVIEGNFGLPGRTRVEPVQEIISDLTQLLEWAIEGKINQLIYAVNGEEAEYGCRLVADLTGYEMLGMHRVVESMMIEQLREVSE